MSGRPPKARKITLTVLNTELDALEDMLFIQLSKSQAKKIRKRAAALWTRLVRAFDGVREPDQKPGSKAFAKPKRCIPPWERLSKNAPVQRLVVRYPAGLSMIPKKAKVHHKRPRSRGKGSRSPKGMS